MDLRFVRMIAKSRATTGAGVDFRWYGFSILAFLFPV